MRIELKGLGFSSAHFVVGHTKCEHLHGHNYKVGVMVEGEEDGRGLVVDFLDLKKVLEGICDSYDHRLLLPTKNTEVKHTQSGKSLKVSVHGRDFVFPAEDVVWVPVLNITVEELARAIAEKTAESLKTYPNVEKITVTVEESEGESAREERMVRSPRR